MLTNALAINVLSLCDPLTLEVLRYVPGLIPSSYIDQFQRCKDVCGDAARCDNIQLLKWARAAGYRWCMYALYSNAGYGGSLTTLAYLSSLPRVVSCYNTSVIASLVYTGAALGDNLNILDIPVIGSKKWFDISNTVTTEVLKALSQRGRIDFIRKFVESSRKDLSYAYSHMCGQAALYGHVEVVNFILSIRRMSVKERNACVLVSCESAILGGHTSILSCISSVSLVDRARNTFLHTAVARSGNVELFDWITSVGLGRDVDKSYCAAAEAGNLEVIKYMDESYEKPDVHTTAAMGKVAAENGHLNVLVWLHVGKCQGNLYKYAAIAGHIDIVKWSIDSNYAVEAKLFNDIAISKSKTLDEELRKLEVIKWLESRCDSVLLTGPVCSSAIRGGNLRILEYFLINGTLNRNDISHIIKRAVKTDNISVLRHYKNRIQSSDCKSYIYISTKQKNVQEPGKGASYYINHEGRYDSMEKHMVMLEWLKRRAGN